MNIRSSIRAAIFFCFIATAVVPAVTHADSVLRTGSGTSVNSGQTVSGNYYVSAGPFGKTVMSGTVDGDMYGLAGSVVVNGTITNDLGLLAGTAQIQGTVNGDVRVVGGDVTITDPVGGDVFVIGNSLTIPSTAHVTGDVFFFGNELDIEGSVDGSVYGSAGKIRINNVVGKNVDVTAANTLSLGDHADVKGTVRYTSLNAIIRGQNSVIEGDVTRVVTPTASFASEAQAALVPFFMVLFATLSLYLLFRSSTERLVVRLDAAFGRSLLVGLAVVVLGPIAALLLIATTIGTLLGVGLLLLIGTLDLMALALVVVVIGTYTLRLYTKDTRVNLGAIALGALVVALLSLIPFMGIIVLAVVFLVTVGALSLTLITTLVE